MSNPSFSTHPVSVYLVNSFVYQDMGGNPAGVCFDLDGSLSDTDMQRISREVGVSETAFIRLASEDADFHIRFFTPTDEVPLCGHATIASFWLLKMHHLISDGEFLQKTGAGILKVRVRTESIDDKLKTLVIMEQSMPLHISHKLVSKESVLNCFPKIQLHDTLLPEIWSTGLEDLLLPLASFEALKNLTVHFDALSKLSKSMDIIGAHAFAFDEAGQLHTRNFAPLYGIDEEAATGTSNGALTAYLHHYLWSNNEKISLSILQGETMQATSQIITESIWSNEKQTVWVGGLCVLNPLSNNSSIT